MTKFEEMCQARTLSVQAWNEYRDRSYRNLITLFQGFVKHCGIPADCVSLAPLDKEIEPEKTYGPGGAIHFDINGGYWRLGFIVTLRENQNTFPQSRILLEIDVREQAGKVLVKRGEGDKPREIDVLRNPKQCADLYDSIADHVKQFYTMSPDNLPDDTTVRRIGFTPTEVS
jgi:hypothetical protein